MSNAILFHSYITSLPGVPNTRPYGRMLGELARPFLLLSSLTPFFKGGKICLGKENFSREVDFVEMSQKFWGDRLLVGIAGKI